MISGSAAKTDGERAPENRGSLWSASQESQGFPQSPRAGDAGFAETWSVGPPSSCRQRTHPLLQNDWGKPGTTAPCKRRAKEEARGHKETVGRPERCEGGTVGAPQDVMLVVELSGALQTLLRVMTTHRGHTAGVRGARGHPGVSRATATERSHMGVRNAAKSSDYALSWTSTRGSTPERSPSSAVSMGRPSA